MIPHEIPTTEPHVNNSSNFDSQMLNPSRGKKRESKEFKKMKKSGKSEANKLLEDPPSSLQTQETSLMRSLFPNDPIHDESEKVSETHATVNSQAYSTSTQHNNFV